MADDLPDGVQLHLRAVEMFGALGFAVLAEACENLLVQHRQIVAGDCLARRDGHIPAAGDGQHAAAHGAIMPCGATGVPTHHRYRETGQEVRVTGLDTEAAAGILGGYDFDVTRVNDHCERRGDAQSHAAWSSFAAAASFCRASSSVPTM